MEQNYLKLSGRSQQLAVDMYKSFSLPDSKLDTILRQQMLLKSLNLNARICILLDEEISMLKLYNLKESIEELIGLNSLIMVGFQLGMLHSDHCINLGQRIEELKSDLCSHLHKEEGDFLKEGWSFDPEDL